MSLPKWGTWLITELDYSLYVVIIRIDKHRCRVKQSVQELLPTPFLVRHRDLARNPAP